MWYGYGQRIYIVGFSTGDLNMAKYKLVWHSTVNYSGLIEIEASSLQEAEGKAEELEGNLSYENDSDTRDVTEYGSHVEEVI